MCSLIQALISVALLSSAAFGLPLAEESVVDDLSLDLPVSGFGSPPNDDNRIYGGTEASIGQFPHQIAVRFAYVLTCGGSIISDRFIITSAQCKVSRRNLFTVLVGSHTGRRDGIIYEVEEFIVHERYKSSKTETAVIIRNDIGLIKTEEPIKFNKQIAPIALQSTFVGGEVHTLTSGWGDSNDEAIGLKYVNMQTLTNAACRKILDDEKNLTVPVHDWDTICALTAKNGQGPCGGDVGGPLISGNKLIGITSWIDSCGSGLPSGFTRISTYIDWISEKTKLSF